MPHRCAFAECRRKLSLVQQSMPCRCTLVFCADHRPSDKHACSFDYVALHQTDLEKKLVKVEADKASKI